MSGERTGAAAGTGQWLSVPQVLTQAERHLQAGRLVAAEDLCRQVLRSRPRHPGALHLLGVIAHQTGQTATAIDLVRQAIAGNGSVALFHTNLGEMCRLSGRIDEAVAAGRRAIALQPDYPQALNNLGIAYFDQASYEQAMECYRRAIALAPGFAEAHSNLGNALRAQHRFEEAITSYEHAIRLKPGFADAIANLGSALHLAGRIDEAFAAFRQAIALDPMQGNAHSGLALLLLLRGELEQGWIEYEWRWRSTEAAPRRLTGPAWRGEDLTGRRLLVYAEQGFGDTLQFCRYIPLLAARGIVVGLHVADGLRELIAESLPGIEVSSNQGPRPAPYDCHCALLSLPLLMRTTMATIPATVPYLRAPAAAVERRRAAIGDGPALRVGLVWAGNPRHINDPKRSMTLAALAPLFLVDGVRWFSLQVGGRAKDLAGIPAGTATDLAAGLEDFSETAAVVANLDLVIAVDTAVAHLAGALGKPVWVMLPWVPDWRWLMDREDSPWYPTMRLFRQPGRGQWEPVVARVAAELAAVAGGARERLLPHSEEVV